VKPGENPSPCIVQLRGEPFHRAMKEVVRDDQRADRSAKVSVAAVTRLGSL
jgi:hypothetical protein